MLLPQVFACLHICLVWCILGSFFLISLLLCLLKTCHRCSPELGHLQSALSRGICPWAAQHIINGWSLLTSWQSIRPAFSWRVQCDKWIHIQTCLHVCIYDCVCTGLHEHVNVAHPPPWVLLLRYVLSTNWAPTRGWCACLPSEQTPQGIAVLLTYLLRWDAKVGLPTLWTVKPWFPIVSFCFGFLALTKLMQIVNHNTSAGVSWLLQNPTCKWFHYSLY